MTAGGAYGIRPAGMLALDVVRLEAGLILLEVDYTSARHALNPEQNYSPVRDRPGPAGRPRQGRLRRPAARSSARQAPAARRGGWSACSSTGTTSRGCTPRRACRPRSPDRSIARPCRSSRGGRQVGRATSHGWSPILKQAIALASVSPRTRRWGRA